MKPLTTSIYTFSDLIAGGYLYVDKTAGIHRLVAEYRGQYFLARPRRFGKSLLVSTLKSIFRGNRELFAGLAIDDLEYDWKPYPVIHLDMGSAAGGSVDEIGQNLLRLVQRAAHETGCPVDAPRAYQALEDLIRALHANQGRAVILIDEYDKPLLGHLGKPSARAIQSLLKQFYAVIKTTESCQRFALLTGVSKFSKVSVFSDLNNLTDLTMDRRSATLLGYTQEELETCFAEHIAALAEANGLTIAEAVAELRSWYNGYRFHEGAQSVYNPVSVMKCLANAEFRNYWFETGTPSFLLELVKRQPIDMDALTVPEDAFSGYEPDRLSVLPLLVQTGYLTILGAQVRGRRREYRLGYPNFEIEESFSQWLAQAFSELPAQELSGALHRLEAALREGRVEEMLEQLKVFFANIPNTISLKHEKYYQTIFFTVFKLLGAVIEAETSTNIGRIDALVKTDRDIFLFEFKLNGTAEQALEQIRAHRYAEAYRDDPRRLTLVGVAFDPAERNLGTWRIERREP